MRDTIDKTTVRAYLDEVDEEIGRIAPQYSLLMDWNVRKGSAWSDAGKVRTPGSLEYGHSLVLSKSSDYLDRYRPNGLHVRLRILSQKMFAKLAGPSIGTVVFGAPLGGGCVVAAVLSEKPKNRELEMRVSDIVRRQLPSQACY